MEQFSRYQHPRHNVRMSYIVFRGYELLKLSADKNQENEMPVIRSLIGCKWRTQNKRTRNRQILNRRTRNRRIRIGEYGIGKHGIGEYGISEYRIGKHGIGKHGIGKYGIGEYGIGEYGIGEYGIGEMLRHNLYFGRHDICSL